jgi:hypothetical protein
MRLITEDCEMAEETNRYFTILFTQETDHDISKAEEEEITIAMPRVEMTRQKIKMKIKELRTESMPGPD